LLIEKLKTFVNILNFQSGSSTEKENKDFFLIEQQKNKCIILMQERINLFNKMWLIESSECLTKSIKEKCFVDELN